jgi:PKD repeat protein
MKKLETKVVILTLACLLGAMAGCEEDAALPPQADFFINRTSGPAPLQVCFQDRTISAEPVTSWLWDFGDGTTDTEPNPIHDFLAAGSYTVSLTVTASTGTHTCTKANCIIVTAAQLHADFVASPTSGTSPLNVQFNDASTSPTQITAWSWTFGDGNTSADQNPNHTYNSDGVYTVSLTITTASGSDVCTKDSLISVGSLTADFTANPTSGSKPLAVQFTDQSISGGTPVSSWSWDFGDGATSTQQDPSHTYTNAGTYTVSLTVTNATGSDTETKTNYITATSTGVNPSNGSGGSIQPGNTGFTSLGSEIYIPTSYAPSTFASPVVWLFNEALNDWKAIADNEKIIVVDLHEYNNTTNIVNKLNESIPILENDYNVDKARYYWAGWSAGGNLVVIIGSQNQSLIAGTMVFPGTGGNMAQPSMQSWTGHKIRMFYACGDQDPNYSWSVVKNEADSWASWYGYTTKFVKVTGSGHYISESTYQIRQQAWNWIKQYNLSN